MHTDRRRPKGITALAILLFAAALGGAVFTVLFTGFLRAGLSPYLLGAVGGGYAVSAAAVAALAAYVYRSLGGASGD